ncbi:MAG: PilW family protein [Betaproteobacteria bacterium]
MMPRKHSLSRRARERGVGLVETMVGILIGTIVIIVVYNILWVAENYKRTTLGSSDAQISGLLSQFVAGRDAGNGGAGITMSNGTAAVPSDMINCTMDETGAAASGLAITSLDAAMRPVPVLISDGGALGLSDSFISYNTGAAHVMWPVDFTATSLKTDPTLQVQSPNGFTVPLPSVTPYWVVMMNSIGNCRLLRVTNAVPDPTIPLTGRVTLTKDATMPASVLDYTVALPARLLSLGPVGLASRIRYDVNGVTGVLSTTDLLVTAALNPVPVAQNIVLMKVQYGIDDNEDGIVDCWTPADASTCGNYAPAAVMAAPLSSKVGGVAVAGVTALNKILAVRIGMVVRSDEADLRLLTDPTNTALQSESSGLLFGSRPAVVLFDCSTHNAACQNRVQVPMGAGAPVGAPTCAPSVICDYWRYRTYETVIPLRNALFSATMP